RNTMHPDLFVVGDVAGLIGSSRSGVPCAALHIGDLANTTGADRRDHFGALSKKLGHAAFARALCGPKDLVKDEEHTRGDKETRKDGEWQAEPGTACQRDPGKDQAKAAKCRDERRNRRRT